MSKQKESGRYSYEGLASPIHEKSRLSIMTSLVSARDALSFNDLKSLCSLSDGNLSRHMLALEEAGLVAITKGYEGRRPRTEYRVTAEGKKSYYGYLDELENVIRDSRREMTDAVRKDLKVKTDEP